MRIRNTCFGDDVTNKEKSLKDYFPMLRCRDELLEEISNTWEYKSTFIKWTEAQQNEFLDICTGLKGPRMTYDVYFKESVNPEYAPERLGDFLSNVLGQKVKVLKPLPNDSVRITLENTLLITDIVVELEDGRILNLEMQKLGYKFPGDRAACYLEDLLLRQYKRVRGSNKEADYRDVKPVYLIVIFENSPKEFKSFAKEFEKALAEGCDEAGVADDCTLKDVKQTYFHHITPISDTGIELNLLYNFYFISLDIYDTKMQNKAVGSKLEAWLRFFASDRPEDIIELIDAYPEFKPMYEDVYKLCADTGGVMSMFSVELYELDRNTMKLMVDEMQDEIDDLKENVDTLKESNDNLQKTNDELLVELKAYKEKFGNL